MRQRIAIICALAATGAVAQESVRLRSAPATTTAVSLSNKRGIALQQFEIFARSDNSRQKLIGKMTRPLAAGESVDVPLTKAKGCVFHARWSFADESDASEVDLCSGVHIVLVD